MEIEVAKSFIVKPAQQEAGCLGNPLCNRSFMRDGIRGGDGAIRERLAYSLQKIIGLDFNIPFTEVLAVNHPLLGITRGRLTSFLTKLNDTLNNPVIFNVDDHILEYSKLNFLEIMSNFLNSIKELVKDEEKPTIFFLKDVFLLCENENNKDGITKKDFQSLFKKNDIKKVLRKDLLMLGMDLVKVLKTPCDVPAIASVQQFIPAGNYGDFNPDELNNIPDVEMHKLIFDLLIFNLDRHMNNILFKNEGSQIKPILIDHGFCLPLPEKPNLENAAKYEWIEMPQFERALCEPYADKLSNINIENLIIALKEDSLPLERKFGDYCKVPEECYSLLRFNFHLLKTGIRLGVSVKTMALFQMGMKINDQMCGMEISNFYEEHILDISPIDWMNIEKKLEIILLKEPGNRAWS
jgi:hypothetical protein